MVGHVAAAPGPLASALAPRIILTKPNPKIKNNKINNNFAEKQVVMYRIERRGPGGGRGSKNRSLGQTPHLIL